MAHTDQAATSAAPFLTPCAPHPELARVRRDAVPVQTSSPDQQQASSRDCGVRCFG
ncbi:MAG: hypothetical protein ACK5F0_00015 [Flavobacteriales bacterium]